jgi:hypothetical protein
VPETVSPPHRSTQKRPGIPPKTPRNHSKTALPARRLSTSDRLGCRHSRRKHPNLPAAGLAQCRPEKISPKILSPCSKRTWSEHSLRLGDRCIHQIAPLRHPVSRTGEHKKARDAFGPGTGDRHLHAVMQFCRSSFAFSVVGERDSELSREGRTWKRAGGNRLQPGTRRREAAPPDEGVPFPGRRGHGRSSVKRPVAALADVVGATRR